MAIHRDPMTGVCRTLTGNVTDHSSLVSASEVASLAAAYRTDYISPHHQSRIVIYIIKIQRINPLSAPLGRLTAMFVVMIILLMIGFVYYAARWILGRSPLYCETCHLNTYVDASGWCHNCHRTLLKQKYPTDL